LKFQANLSKYGEQEHLYADKILYLYERNMKKAVIIQFNSVHLFMYLTAAKQGQLQLSRIKYNVIKSTNDVRDQEITLKNKRNTVEMYNMKPTVCRQRKVKRKSNYK
jgi:hypothetical protein